MEEDTRVRLSHTEFTGYQDGVKERFQPGFDNLGPLTLSIPIGNQSQPDTVFAQGSQGVQGAGYKFYGRRLELLVFGRHLFQQIVVVNPVPLKGHGQQFPTSQGQVEAAPAYPLRVGPIPAAHFRNVGKKFLGGDRPKPVEHFMADLAKAPLRSPVVGEDGVVHVKYCGWR